MDRLTTEFKRLYDTGLLPLEVLTELVTTCDEEVKFTIGLDPSSTKVKGKKCAVTFSIDRFGKDFLGVNESADKALESAAKKAYDYLKVVAQVEEKDTAGSVLEVCSVSGKTDEELAQILIDIKNMGYDVEHLNHKSINSAFNVVYNATILIPGFGEYIGQSVKSKSAAYQEASDKLKTFYRNNLKKLTLNKFGGNNNDDDSEEDSDSSENFEDVYKDFDLAMNHLVEDDDFVNSPDAKGIPFKEQEEHMKTGAISSEVPKNLNQKAIPSTSPPGQLMQQAAQLITLINRFNSVFHPGKTPLEVMDEIINLGPDHFSFSTQRMPNGLFQTKVTAFNLETFEGYNKQVAKSKGHALKKQYAHLHNLAKFFVEFKSLNKPDKTPEAILLELINQDHSNLLQIRKYPPRPEYKQISFKTNITIENLLNVTHLADTEDASWKYAASKAIAQLTLLSPSIRDSANMKNFLPLLPTPVNWSSSSERTVSESSTVSINSPLAGSAFPPLDPLKKSILQKTSPKAPFASKRILSPKPPAQAASPVSPNLESSQNLTQYLIPRDLRLIQLINLFNSVYLIEKPPMEVMEELLNIDRSEFQIKTRQTEDDLYLTTVNNSDLGMFFALAQTEAESRDQGVLQAFDLLHRLDNLFADFASIYMESKSPIDYIPILIAKNHHMITFQVWPRAKYAYQAALVIEHVHYFNETAASEAEVSRFVFSKVADYLQKFSAQIHRKIPPKKVPVLGELKTEENNEEVEIYKNNKERIELLNSFISVYDPSKSPTDIMSLLSTKCPELVNIGTMKMKNHYVTTLTLTKIQEFKTNGRSWSESRSLAAMAAHRQLNNLVFIFRTFQISYSPYKSSTEIIETIHNANPELIHYQSTPKYSQVKIATLTTITEHDENQGQSKKVANQKAVDFLKIMAGWIKESRFEMHYMP